MISARSTTTASDPSLGDPGSAGGRQAEASSKIGCWLPGPAQVTRLSPARARASKRLTVSERPGRASVPLSGRHPTIRPSRKGRNGGNALVHCHWDTDDVLLATVARAQGKDLDAHLTGDARRNHDRRREHAPHRAGPAARLGVAARNLAAIPVAHAPPDVPLEHARGAPDRARASRRPIAR